MGLEELEVIEALWAAATPGPWYQDINGNIVAGQIVDPEYSKVMGYDEPLREFGVAGCEVGQTDGAAIAKAPEHIAALVSEVRRLKTLLEPFAVAGRAYLPGGEYGHTVNPLYRDERCPWSFSFGAIMDAADVFVCDLTQQSEDLNDY